MPVARPDQRPLGVVYTPPEIARPMVRLAIAPLLRGRTAQEILAMRVCDPALGEGAFLVEAVELLAEQLECAWRSAEVGIDPAGRRSPAAARRQVAATCVAGVDVDAAAVETATARLGASRDQLRVTDALELDWAAAYPEVFERGGFDVLIGNPPYVRQERLASARRRGKVSLEDYETYDGTADLYVYFIELAHRVLRHGGRYCLIVPNKWMTAAYGRRLRAFLAAEGSLDGLVDLSRVATFAEADAFPCVLWGTVGRPTSAPIRALRADAGTTAATALQRVEVAPRDDARPDGDGAGDGADDAADDGPPAAAGPHDHPRDRWGDAPWHVETPAERALLDRIERTWPTLEQVVGELPARGVVTGLNRAFVIDRATHDSLLAQEPAAAALIRPFVKGRDLTRWATTAPERWVLLIDRGTRLDHLPAVTAHLAGFRKALEPRPPAWKRAWHGRKPGTYAWYELQDPVGPLVKRRAPRLLYQDIQTSPTCGFDREGDLVPDTTIWMLPTDDRVVLALLNSPLYGWYARHRFPPALNGAVRPKLEYMRRLPVAQPAPPTRRVLESLVDRRLELSATLRSLDAELAPPRGHEAARLEARRRAVELDLALGEAIAAAYELTSSERALVGTD